ncbi:oligosaccharide flippase family protein [Mucilaginibacter pallidiroseus]|uniref:Oligosaccharide flippase family protein n=1 Tax=Mucilaginibacter pallidiroseus TaxID=2599295 RepID=A0A563UGT2_9SPHI|nr:oligosaccharide flippase family protein [Mucilaginibacter pallidiroseus]TWR30499.1 oligosaccharide flippase family protein [Mucilaginibacter pallidiroseus]
MSTAKKFAGQTLIYGLSTMVSRLIAFILTPLYARTLPVAGNGIFTSLYGTASLANAVLAFGMESTFFRYLNKHSDRKQQVYNNSFGVIIAVSLIFLLSCLLFLNPIVEFLSADATQDSRDYKFYLKCFLFILVCDAFCVIPFAKIRADGRPMRFGAIKLANIILMLSFNLFFLFVIPYILRHHMASAEWFASWYRAKWVGYVFLSNAAASVFTILLLLPEISKLRLRFDMQMLKNMFVYSWPVLIANISFIINESIDKTMLKQLLPTEISDKEVGIYGMCAKIALFLSITVSAFRLGAEPFFFSHAKNKNAGEIYAKVMNYFVIVVTVICVGLVANVNIFAYIIMGANKPGNVYWTGIGVVPPLLFGYVSLGIYGNLSIWYKLSDQTKYGLYISVIGAFLTIVLNYIYIPKYSYIASAWISLIAYASMMIMSYIWGQKNYPIPYNLNKNLAYILISVVLVYLSFVVFKRNIFIGNGLFILFALGALYLERNELKAIFKR